MNLEPALVNLSASHVEVSTPGKCGVLADVK
jgi:hypothetical protein